MGFDIDGLLDFEPASGRCVKCLALLPGVKDSVNRYQCQVCGLSAIRSAIFVNSTNMVTSGVAVSSVANFSDSFGPAVYGLSSIGTGLLPNFLLPLTFNKDAMDHAKELAGLARLLRSTGDQPPLRVLVACLLRARAFVHFTTWGISQAMLGVLAAVSEFVPVAGIASGVDGNTETEITKLRSDFPNLDIRAVSKRGADSDLIHVKLIVIDGLLALSGSPNLTTDAWRKAAANKERVDIVTDVQRVIEDNNRYFAGHWAELRSDFDPSAFSSWGWSVYQPGDVKSVDAAKGEA